MMPKGFSAPPVDGFDDEGLAKDIDTKIRELNSMCDTALRQGISVQVTMIAREGVPAFRLDGVYKRLDKPLILRV